MDPSLTKQSSLLQSRSAAQIELVTMGAMDDSESAHRVNGSLIWIETIADEDGEGDETLPRPPPAKHGATANKLGGSFSALAAHMERSSKSTARASSVFVQRGVKTLPRIQPDPRSSKATQPLMGVQWQQFCPCSGKYLACREESQLRCMWIWSMVDVKLCSVLLLQDNILGSAWRPALPSFSATRAPLLAICTGTSRIYFYAPTASNPLFWADAPVPPPVVLTGQLLPTNSSPIPISSLQWSPDGSLLLLQSRESFLTCSVSWDGDGDDAVGPSISALDEYCQTLDASADGATA